jgi:hypothetical protein
LKNGVFVILNEVKDLLLYFRNTLQNNVRYILPLPWWEGVGGREEFLAFIGILSPPTPALPHQGGGSKALRTYLR